MFHQSKVVVVIAIALVSACKKKESDQSSASSGPQPSAKPETAKTGTPAPSGSGPFAAWNIPARKQAFQGAMVGPGDAIGMWQAWNVEGDKITIWDGKVEKVAELSLPSPCQAVVTEKSADGSSSSTTHHFTIENGQIVTGLGDAGSRKDNTAVACVSNKVFTLDAAGTCLEWDQDMFEKTKYKSEPGKCAFAKNGDKEVFKVAVNGMDTELEVHGDALYSTQIANTHSEKAADWAAAKAMRDAKK